MLQSVTRLLWFVVVTIIVSCASSGETSESNNSAEGLRRDKSVVEVNNVSLALSDYLRRVSGVVVYGSGSNVKITIRGSTSLVSSTDPLFVIDGQRVGRSYVRVSGMVPVTEIDRIRVLKGVEASAGYGLEGGNGVIEIFTKSSR